MRNSKINLNGNRYEDLAEELDNARDAAEALLEALGKLTVHGRNYIPQGMGEGWEADRAEKFDLIQRAKGISTQLFDIRMEFLKNNEAHWRK